MWKGLLHKILPGIRLGIMPLIMVIVVAMMVVAMIQVIIAMMVVVIMDLVIMGLVIGLVIMGLIGGPTIVPDFVDLIIVLIEVIVGLLITDRLYYNEGI